MYRSASDTALTTGTGHIPDSVDRRLTALSGALVYCRTRTFEVAAISVALAIPCLWHRFLVPVDLASHTYNAWLHILVSNGTAPGLWVARPITNLLFGSLLFNLARLVGFDAAERMAAYVAVLVFFWGSYAFIRAASRSEARFTLPFLFTLAYGYVFYQGLFNYYLSLGLCLFALALLLHENRLEATVGAGLIALAFLAHPLPVIWCCGSILYIWLLRRWQRPVALFTLAVCVLVAIRWLIGRRYPTFWSVKQVQYITGADQLFVFDRKYELLALALLFLLFACVAAQLKLPLLHWLRTRGRDPLTQLYLLCAIGIFVMPIGISRKDGQFLFTFIPERLSLIAAVLILAVIANGKPRKWYVAAILPLACVYFALLWVDTGKIDRVATQMGALLKQVPPNARVLANIPYEPVRFNNLGYIVNRLCIGNCFAYSNYEASTNLFEIRATPGNRIVMDRLEDAVNASQGVYKVKHDDIPIFEVFRCGAPTDLCIRSLSVGEMNGAATALSGASR